MSKLNTVHFKIVLNTNVGTINEKKADIIADKFKEDFPIKVSQEKQGLGNVFYLANPLTKEAILVEENKVTYQIDSEARVEPNFVTIKENLKKLYSTLLLDEDAEVIIHYIGSTAATTENAMEESTTKLSAGQEIKQQMENLKGIGLRFLIEHRTGLWEYKVEPLINDPRFYFIEMICNINKQKSIDEIVHVAEESYIDFNEKKLGALKLLGI
ncbi:hypothetical protein [Bacillus cereus]|uniref:hypothetical protein n=1 Tax=Bacillus cereus TaxID=1396 RepID=UPI000BFE3394|nr:hypothetical protein [Bacillus cereus]PGL32164.1 hypothetical protein CN913_27815 [Bacillus cereus]